MRIVLLTHYFPPEVGAPQTRLGELATALVRRGHDVVVHTAPPHYPDGVVPPRYRHRPLTRERTPDGVRILRSPVYATPNRRFTRRLLNHLSHAVSALATSSASGRCDVVVAETPPLFTAAAGVLYARAKRVPLLLNVADLWPESAVELGVLTQPRAVEAATRLANWCYGSATCIAVPTPGMEQRLTAMPHAGEKVVCVPPAVDAARFPPLPPPGDGPLRVAYAGTVGLAHGIGTLVEAARLAGPAMAQVTIAGSGAEAPLARTAAQRDGVDNVHFAGAVSSDRVPQLYADHHAGVVLLRDRPLFASALPTKLLEIMAAGRPAVVSAPGDAATLVRDTGSGLAVAPENPHALAGAFAALADEPEARRRLGDAGRAHVVAAHAREGMVDRWEELAAEAALSRAVPAARR